MRSLARWLRTTGVDVAARVVCEVGFGGGHVLAGLARLGASVQGIEAHADAVTAAQAIGLDPTLLHTADRLPARLDPRVDVWLFLDSFEHLPAPDEFLSWMRDSSNSGAVALLVAPNAASLSARWLGRAWPHRLPDHMFHWTRAGLEAIWGRHGWVLQQTFLPIKLISPATVATHLHLHRCNTDRETGLLDAWLHRLRGIVLPFNIGELGLVFARARASDNP